MSQTSLPSQTGPMAFMTPRRSVVVPGDEEMDDPRPEVEAVEDRVADEEQADEQEPDRL